MISKNKVKQNFITTALFILFKIILDYTYINFVSVVYNYDGYLFTPFKITDYAQILTRNGGKKNLQYFITEIILKKNI